ncbi:hypothetical protein [Methanobacterium sp.]|uniref:hypothetical protein n=1 Tax=Methanobacterium sp. TaxID=2164 RepID=UPI003C76B42B
MKKRVLRGLLALFLIVNAFFLPVISLSSAAYAPINQNLTVTADRTYPAVSKNNLEIYTYFNKIAASPYDKETNNCKIKSEKFAKYLVSNGATNVYHVQIQYKDNVQFHECVEWQGKIYDPTIPVYAMNENKYFNLIKSYGLDGLKFISPYS